MSEHQRKENTGESDRIAARPSYVQPKVEEVLALQTVVMGSFSTTEVDSGTLGPRP